MHSAPDYSIMGIPLIPEAMHLPVAKTTQATVLSADLHGYGALVERLPPMDVLVLIEEFLAVIAGAVLQHGGQIFHLSETGLMAGFGVGDSRHTQNREALYAATAMLRSFAPVGERWRRDRSVDVGVGIGIHRGQMAIGFVEFSGHREAALVGEAANVAALLSKRARAGEILLTAAIYRACDEGAARAAAGESAAYLHLPELRLRGRSAPLDVWCAPSPRRQGGAVAVPPNRPLRQYPITIAQ